MKTMRKVLTYFVIAAVAFLSAVNYEIFIFPNEFAPSGINGICTMIQYVTGINLGYMSLLINIPLSIWVYLKVSKS
ncbi:MAG: YitT family protein, partial [Oscillospiraceae bacterium]|nr:YitT family protein [Oscillospiraceae bacterium]